MSRDEWSENLIIRACLAPNEQLPALFEQFAELGSLDELNPGVIRLLPYLYRRLERTGIAPPQLGVMKGVYLKSWYQHQVSRRKTLDTVLELLGDTEFLALKGIALQALVYNSDPPTRPGDDVDILIRPEGREQVLERFLSRGFRIAKMFPKAHVLNLQSSVSLTRQDEHVDLHWALYPSVIPGAVVRDLFDRSIMCDNRGHTFSTASVTDHLLHGLAHGSAKNEISPIRWVLDCALLLQHPDCDLQQLVDTASAWGWADVAVHQLERLRRDFGLQVDPKTLAALHSARTPGYIRLFHWSRSLRPSIGRKALAVLFINGLYGRENSLEKNLPLWLWAVRATVIRLQIALRSMIRKSP